MKTLKTLTFGVLNKGAQDPALARRAKLVQRLEQQRALALNPSYVRTFQRWIPNDRGSKDLVEVQKRVRPWWRPTGWLRLIAGVCSRPKSPASKSEWKVP